MFLKEFVSYTTMSEEELCPSFLFCKIPWSRYNIDIQALSKPICEQTSWRTNRFCMPLDCLPSLFKLGSSGSIGTIYPCPMVWTNGFTEWQVRTVLNWGSLGWPKCMLIYLVFLLYRHMPQNLLSHQCQWLFIFEKWLVEFLLAKARINEDDI